MSIITLILSIIFLLLGGFILFLSMISNNFNVLHSVGLILISLVFSIYTIIIDTEKKSKS